MPGNGRVARPATRARIDSGSVDQAKRERLWDEARRRCRLSSEAIRMAKEMGLNPRSLIKNIPSPSQPWKAPVEVCVRENQARRMGGSKRKRTG